MDRTLKSINFFNSEIDEDTVCAYEVFRIENGKPIFLDQHLHRLQKTLAIADIKPMVKVTQLHAKLKLLFSANTINDGNVRLDYRQLKSGEQQFFAYFVESNYPNANLIKEGIICSLQHSVRHHPAAKIHNPEVRDKANAIIEQRHVYETLLVNADNCLTEGSRSNLFFIRQNDLITADDSVVLGGIMRQQIINIAQTLGVNIEYRALCLNEISEMDGAFISGTSPRMLPIKQIGDVCYPVLNPLFSKIYAELSIRIKEQVK